LLSAEIGGGCGVKFCHARAGSSMAKLEVEYGNIKKAIEEDNLSEAEKHLSDFKKYWTESKKDVSIIMPRITEVLMRDEYLKELEKAIESRNETEAKKAISLISNTTCSFTGCHRVFFETMTLWKF
jgi:type 1 glutamine amidotransferase